MSRKPGWVLLIEGHLQLNVLLTTLFWCSYGAISPVFEPYLCIFAAANLGMTDKKAKTITGLALVGHPRPWID
jgi:hypothetical protein